MPFLLLREIYLDNAATTKPCEEAISAMVNAMQNSYANPSALHLKGLESEDAVFDATRKVAKALGVNSNNLYFTSGGTESNNLALFGGAETMKRRGKRIITTSVEHPSVLNACNIEADECNTVKNCGDDNYKDKK